MTDPKELISTVRNALEYARPLLVSYAGTQGNLEQYVADITAPVDTGLSAADALASLSASVGVTDEQVEAAANALWDDQMMVLHWKAATEIAATQPDSDYVRHVATFRKYARRALEAALSLPSSGGEVVADAVDVDRSLDAQREHLKSLGSNWDGYGANPLNMQRVDRVINAVRGSDVLVDIVPGGDGSIQAEWHVQGTFDIEFCVTPDGTETLYVHRVAASTTRATESGK